MAAWRGELDRVGQQVPEQLGDAQRVDRLAPHRGRGEHQVDPLAFGFRPDLLDRLERDVREIRRAELHGQLARLDLGQEQQVPDEAQQSLGVALDHLGEVLRVQPGGAIVPQQLHVADDRGQRGPQFVRDQGDELVLERVQFQEPLVPPGQLEGLIGQRVLGLDLGGDIPGDAEGADDLAVLIPQRHLGGRHPGVRPAAVGLQLHLPDDRLAGLDDPLLVGEGGRGVLGAEHVEVGLAGQFRCGPARRARGDPAGADEQEPAHPVLEVHPFAGGGQQVAHAGLPEPAALRALLLPWRGQPGPGHRDPPIGRR